MTFATIQALLEAQVATVVGLPLYQMENTRISPVAGSPWCRSTFLPARTVQETVGMNGRNRLSGLFQIDLFYPSDKGTATANAMTDLVIAAFPRGLQLTSSGVTVLVETSWREAAYKVEQYYNTPVVLKWRCHD